MIDLLRLRVIRKGLQDIEHFVVDERGMGKMDVRQVKSDMEWLVDMIKNQQATIDSLSMAHDAIHREMPKDKHTLIKNIIGLNNQVQELERELKVSQSIHADDRKLLIGRTKQNERYRQLLESLRYTQDIATEIQKENPNIKVITPDDLLQHMLRKINEELEESE